MQKETFVVLINGVVEQMKLEEKLSKSISVCFAEPVLFNISHNFSNKIIDALAEEFNDTKDEYGYHTISWFLYDSPAAGENKESCWVEFNDKRYSILDAGELYDFLIDRQAII
jgi:hypothetical protein